MARTNPIVIALNEKAGLTLTDRNYDDWMEGGSTYSKFDRAAKAFLGEELYDVSSVCARTDLVLCAKLGVDLGNEPVMKQELKLAQAIIANPKRYANGF